MEQDWKPLILVKDSAKKVTKSSTSKVIVNKQTQSSINTRKLESDEDYKPPKITREIGLQIQQARVAKGLNQDQLAQQCKLSKSIISEFERGQGVYNRAHLDPICKVLHIKISKPKPGVV